jgi:Paraquat-inducible protein A
MPPHSRKTRNAAENEGIAEGADRVGGQTVTTTDAALSEPLLPTSLSEEEAGDPVIDDAVADHALEIEDESPVSRSEKPVALAFAPTTNCYGRFLIPLGIVLTHGLFFYGQTRDMWSLISHYQADVKYEATTMVTRVTLDALHLPHSHEYVIPETDHVFRTYTYVYAMKELWNAQHMPGLFLPRLAAAGLFLFSGIWPHLKLVMLHISWFTSFRNFQRRQRTLASLSVLGKWSLVDVLVVCVMVGVLHLQWTFTAEHVLGRIETHLPEVVTLVHTLYSAEQLCTMALKYSCQDPKNINHIIECKACRSTINAWFDHPASVKDVLQGLDTSGGGSAQLSVVGLRGIYAFCGAVILSILLSFIVDWFDLQYRSTHPTTVAALENGAVVEVASPTDPSVTTTRALEEGSTNESDDAILEQLLLASANGTRRDARSRADREFDRAVRMENQRLPNCLWQGLSYVTVVLVILATVVITMERRVFGALPKLLEETLDVVWTKQYNFVWLGYTTALAGKWDLMLMSTFVWFIIAGPIVRAILCLFANRLYEKPTMSQATIVALYKRKRRLSIWIDFIGAFCAWEVFAVAVIMVDLLMPSITSTILMDPRCTQLIPDESTCFQVEFDIVKVTFWMVVVGGCLLLLVSQHVRKNMEQICD